MHMHPEQWDRVKELYEKALERDPTQRADFVQRMSTDVVVRTEVLRLLSEHDNVGSFLSTPPLVDYGLPAAQVEKQFAPGEVLAGRFRVITFLAAGGMGEVYKAEDTRLDRIVVLKFLPKELAEDRQSLERFRHEAKAASALNHPNICTVYDFGEDAGRAFIAMEYLDGETLSARIKKGPLPLDEVLKIAIAVVGALGTAHRKGIIHRDLKPGNVMLTDTGAKLLDFGLAKYERPVVANGDTITVLTGEAQVVGTLPYMSPEQLHGGEVDARCDIFAFGAVLYEMLTGRRAFDRRSSSETIIAVDRDEPPPVREVVKEVPEELEKIVLRCLRKQAADRYGSVAEIQGDLEFWLAQTGQPASGIDFRVLRWQSKRPAVRIPALLAIVILACASGWWVHRSFRVRWAREQALPQIAQLVEEEKVGEAYTLAVQAERYLPRDPMLAKFWQHISWSQPITSEPAGASVYRRDYAGPSQKWELVGRTPIQNRRFPLVDSQWKFELPGYVTVERATFPDDTLAVHLEQQSSAPPGMVRVELATLQSATRPVGLFGIPGYEAAPSATLTDFWLDKFEVTNAQFKEFIDKGGYQNQQYWKEQIRINGRVLPWSEAIKLFVDKTGRPGPANWIQGEYPKGQSDYPVTGVSWFEAAAYAEFAGKSLPTIYHWKAAASPWNGSTIIPSSNFRGAGPVAVGTTNGMSWSGTYDLAGNVKEWIWNEASPGKRYILGGAWDEPTYMFFNPDARSPLERAANFGFRCAKYTSTDESAKATLAINLQSRDFRREQPVTQQVFEVYRRLYSYEKTPLHDVVEYTHPSSEGTVQKITLDAAYGGERVIAYLFLPKVGAPPFQTVVYFPGAGALHQRSSFNLEQVYMEEFDFILKSGRAVLFPVYKGTFDRWDNFVVFGASNSAYRDHVLAWAKDLSRSIDYLESRQDIQSTDLAYMGYSWGAAMGAILPAVDRRFKAMVLISPGFYLQKRFPEVDQLNFAPRALAPALMLNGRFDFLFPTATSQEPMFNVLGAPKEHKRRVVYDTSHDIPRPEMIKETLNWLDRYLGPVK